LPLQVGIPGGPELVVVLLVLVARVALGYYTRRRALEQRGTLGLFDRANGRFAPVSRSRNPERERSL